MAQTRTPLMDERAVRRALSRMAREIVERTGGSEQLVLMGIHRRGDEIAALLRDEIQKAEGAPPPIGSLDITLYRDDLGAIGPRPVVGETRLPADGIDGRIVVIVDDVLYTGRTVRAALDELMDWGRPDRILLCVLADRGGRELPIQPDIVGKQVEVSPKKRVEVLVPALDGQLAVEIVRAETQAEGA
jgi:pyrimidine operon attenuation protein/uracil phosphoribosyltransferase